MKKHLLTFFLVFSFASVSLLYAACPSGSTVHFTISKKTSTEHTIYLKQFTDNGIEIVDSAITKDLKASICLPENIYPFYIINVKGQGGYFSHFIPDEGKDVFVEIAEFNKDFTYVDAGMRFNKWVKGKEIFRLIFANYRVDRKFPRDKGPNKDVQLEKVRKKYEDMIYHQVALFFEMEELLGYFNLKHIIEILRSHDPSKELMDKIKALAFNPKNKDLLKEYDVINTINTLKTYHEVAINHNLFDFTMPSSMEDSISTMDYRGKYLLIDFWGSHCAPCIKKNKVIAEKFGQLQIHNVDVLGVFIDYSNKSMEASHFKKSQKHFEPYPWKQVFMFKGKDSEEVVDFYQAYLVPKTALVSPSGKILAVDIETVEEIMEIVNQPQN